MCQQVNRLWYLMEKHISKRRAFCGRIEWRKEELHWHVCECLWSIIFTAHQWVKRRLAYCCCCYCFLLLPCCCFCLGRMWWSLALLVLIRQSHAFRFCSISSSSSSSSLATTPHLQSYRQVLSTAAASTLLMDSPSSSTILPPEASSSSSEDHNDDDITNLFTWLHSHQGYYGAKLGIKNFESGLRGVEAKAPITADEIIMEVPWSISIHVRDSDPVPSQIEAFPIDGRGRYGM